MRVLRLTWTASAVSRHAADLLLASVVRRHAADRPFVSARENVLILHAGVHRPVIANVTVRNATASAFHSSFAMLPILWTLPCCGSALLSTAR